MTPETYKVAHLLGLLVLALGLGAILNGPRDSKPKIGMAMHGIGLLLLLIAGFGTLAKQNIEITTSWVLCKLLIWCTFGAMPFFVNKPFFPRLLAWALVIALAGGSAYLGVLKPALF